MKGRKCTNLFKGTNLFEKKLSRGNAGSDSYENYCLTEV